MLATVLCQTSFVEMSLWFEILSNAKVEPRGAEIPNTSIAPPQY